MSKAAMDSAVQKAAVLIEALPYIRSFRKKVVAIKLGGSAMEDEKKVRSVLEDVTFMESVGMRPLIIHGGGPAISAEMNRLGKKPEFIHGHRVTDQETLDIARSVLVDRVNAAIVKRLTEFGVKAKTVFGDPLRARPKKLVTTETDGSEREYDLGKVGILESIDEDYFRSLFDEEVIPVVSPIARAEDGEYLNVNADTAAAFIAGRARAEKIVFLSDTHGILTDPNDPESYAETLDEGAVREMIRAGVISGGMRPKVDACLDSLRAGVRKAHIVDGRIQHSVLLEIFTRKGVGTQIVE